MGLESLRIERGILILVGVIFIKLFNVVYSIMNTFVLLFCIYFVVNQWLKTNLLLYVPLRLAIEPARLGSARLSSSWLVMVMSWLGSAQ